jgi:hypothetical protein
MTMLFSFKTLVIAAIVFTLMAAVGAAEEARPPGPRPVRPAAFESIPSDAPKTIQFNRRPARVGDNVDQTLSLEVRLATSVRKGNEVVEKSQNDVCNKQRRSITTTGVTAGRTSAVRVTYFEVTKEVSGLANEAIDQAVAGKTYLCRRDIGESASDEGQLIVTDEQGKLPSLEEYEIVAANMEMVGRPNPLAEFLAGRAFKTGQTIPLPKNIANQVFNLGEQFGDVTRFELTLENVHAQDGVTCAAFTARVEASSSGSSQMGIQVEGPFVVETDTCRVVKVNLIGPIGMSDSRGSYSTAYQIIGTGQLQVSISSTFQDAKR